jgi:hypothetical protein
MTELYTAIPGLDHSRIDGQWLHTSRAQLEQFENVRSSCEHSATAANSSTGVLLGSNPKPKSEETSELLPNKTEAGSWTEEKWIERKGKPYGPYLYRRWRESGKLRSQYLGKLE